MAKRDLLTDEIKSFVLGYLKVSKENDKDLMTGILSELENIFGQEVSTDKNVKDYVTSQVNRVNDERSVIENELDIEYFNRRGFWVEEDGGLVAIPSDLERRVREVKEDLGIEFDYGMPREAVSVLAGEITKELADRLGLRRGDAVRDQVRDDVEEILMEIVFGVKRKHGNIDFKKWQILKKGSLKRIGRVVKKEDGYYVESEKGRNLGGPYKTKEEAEKRLRQVEYFKHKGRKMVEKKVGCLGVNYETWSTALWIKNDAATNKFFAEMAERFKGDIDAYAEAMKDFWEAELDRANLSGLFADLASNALAQVDWFAIAEKFMPIEKGG